MENMTIRNAAEKAGVRLWQIADALRTTDSNLSRKLRHELPAEETERLLGIIDKLAEEKEAQR